MDLTDISLFFPPQTSYPVSNCIPDRMDEKDSPIQPLPVSLFVRQPYVSRTHISPSLSFYYFSFLFLVRLSLPSLHPFGSVLVLLSVSFCGTY
ncbi:hypothetical protein I7I48_01843 [Histoplasma ohiense]|nr:hypothetical protein I7I48_01843 [Histoplasma ohiense (nom. inval.)]